MKVLIACEYSGIVRTAFTDLGHCATSVDLIDSEMHGNHIIGDCLDLINDPQWDLIIAHPPCTYIANVGSRWFSVQPDRREKMILATAMFKKILSVNKRLCVENPIPSKQALEQIGCKYSQIIQPYQFGHPYSKSTCLWLKDLPLLQPTEIINQREVFTDKFRNPIDRSRTFKGIAEAMSAQWG